MRRKVRLAGARRVRAAGARRLRVALVLGALVALAGGGGIAASATLPEPAPPAVRAPEPVPALVSGLVPGLAAAEPGQRQPVGRQRAGTVERVDRALGYLDPVLRLRYPGAEYVKVHIGRSSLLPGDYLTVSDPAGEEVYRYPAGSGGGWAMSVTGDAAVVRLHRAGGTTPEAGGGTTPAAGEGLGVVTVDKVARGLPPGGTVERRPESVCGRNDSRDAVCYRSSQREVYRNTKPVARLLIDGVELCTAFRVGPHNRLLTNHHCLDSSRQARRTEVWFNYQCATCGGWAVYRPTKVRGDRVLDTDGVLDYTLFTVDDFAAVERYGYLELDPEPPEAGDELYIPQHPRGLPARVAIGSDRDRGGSCAVTDPRAHGYGWFTDVSYYCDTDGGSSGSPVLSRGSHQVVALHHFGGCPNSGVRIDLIRSRIGSSI